MKRFVDFFGSLICILLLSPVLIVVSFLILIKIGSPVLFFQARPGMGGEIFKIMKFRTMTNEKDESGQLLASGLRMTKFGGFLRSTSLDELPELFNVLIGHMSFVGPRPLLVEYLPLYNEEQKFRHNMKPGITGWAQVNGRNSISWNDKFELDVWYVNNFTLVLDIKILFLTLSKVLNREGITHSGDQIMPKFTGDEKE